MSHPDVQYYTLCVLLLSKLCSVVVGMILHTKKLNKMMIILHIQLAAESTQIITVDSTITAAYVCRYYECVCV